MIRPCNCETMWHRCCIQELIVKAEFKRCPICNFEYSVGYKTCLALFNKERPNYLLYMLVQEVLLYAFLTAFAVTGWSYVIWLYNLNNTKLTVRFCILESLVCWVPVALSVFLLGFRI